MGAGSPPPTTILVIGAYQAGKKRLVSAFTGKPFSECVVEVGEHTQLKGTKGHVTLMGMPEEFGRSPVYRERNKAVADSHAFIMMFKHDTVQYLEHYYTPIKEHSKGGPVLILVSYTTDPTINTEISKFAKSINAKVETINAVKLDEKNDAEIKKMENIISTFANSVKHDATPTPTPTETLTAKSTPASKSSSNRLVRFFSNIFTKANVMTTSAA